MISSLLLLSAAALIADPVIISEVKAIREAGHLRVEVVGDGGIDPDGARTVIDEGRLLIYLGGTRVKADNRAWDLEDGAGEIRAHRHRTETELVVPLAGNGCTGPVELAGSNTGITALVGCDGAVPAPRPAPAVKRIKTPAISLSDDQKLKALVGLDPVPLAAARAIEDSRVTAQAVAVAKVKPEAEPIATEKTEAPRNSARSAPSEPTPTAALVAPIVIPIAELPRVSLPAPASVPAVPVAAPSAEAAAAVTPVVAPGLAPLPAPAVVLPSNNPVIAATKPASGGFGAVGVPALLLGALAVAAYLFARRRRASIHRHIQIVETASLGPKRSLIIARVGDQTLILGSSEAGITLLKTGPSSASSDAAMDAGIALAMGAAPAPGVDLAGTIAAEQASAIDTYNELNQPLEEALADIPEPDEGRGPGGHAVNMSNLGGGRGAFRAIEGGLGGLFGRRGTESDDKGQREDRFDDLLEDSVEDQELRRKLAAGMSARVR